MEAVRKRKSPPLGKRPWTPEDENYLAEKWGYASVPAIAKKLNRTEERGRCSGTAARLGGCADGRWVCHAEPAARHSDGKGTRQHLPAQKLGREPRPAGAQEESQSVQLFCGLFGGVLEMGGAQPQFPRLLENGASGARLGTGMGRRAAQKGLPRLRDPAQGSVDSRRGQPP